VLARYGLCGLKYGLGVGMVALGVGIAGDVVVGVSTGGYVNRAGVCCPLVVGEDGGWGGSIAVMVVMVGRLE